MTAQKEQGSLRRVNASVDEVARSLVGRFQTNRGVRRMLVLVVVAFALFAALRPGVYLSTLNLQNIAVAAPEIGVLAIAQMLAMLTGGIDLSIVAVANLTAITISTLYTAAGSRGDALGPVFILIGLVVALVGGLVNGLLVSRVGITPILATLATMQIFNGLAVVWTGGRTLYGAPRVLTGVGNATVGGIPVLFIALLLVAAGIGILINRTALGHKIQLQGANPTAAAYSGISSRRTLLGTYVMTGLLGGIAGMLFIARNPTASADYGASYTLLVIVIAVLGGTNPNGGFATVTGVVLAALTLQIVSSGFNAMRWSPYQYAVAQCLILIVVMVSDQVHLRRRRRGTPPALPVAAATPPTPV